MRCWCHETKLYTWDLEDSSHMGPCVLVHWLTALETFLPAFITHYGFLKPNDCMHHHHVNPPFPVCQLLRHFLPEVKTIITFISDCLMGHSLWKPHFNYKELLKTLICHLLLPKPYRNRFVPFISKHHCDTLQYAAFTVTFEENMVKCG